MNESNEHVLLGLLAEQERLKEAIKAYEALNVNHAPSDNKEQKKTIEQ
jgi:hypothetical protein